MKSVDMTLALLVSGVSTAAAAAERIEIHPGDWTFSGQGNFVGKQDCRDLYQIIHPWTTSKAQDFGQIEASVTIPAGARPPYALAFHVTDSNYGFTPITRHNLNIAAMQAYAAYLTQDPELAEIARRTWAAGLQGNTIYPEMAYDLAGVVHWLEQISSMVASANNAKTGFRPE